jgi:hypothetical protein
MVSDAVPFAETILPYQIFFGDRFFLKELAATKVGRESQLKDRPRCNVEAMAGIPSIVA